MAAGLAVLAGGVSGTGQPPPAAAQELDDGPLADGGEVGAIYRRDCATCHGAGGEGTIRGPELTDVGRASVFYWVATGRMPLEDEDDEVERGTPAYPEPVVAALVDYVAALTGNRGLEIPDVDPAAGDLAEGGVLWRLNCAACHAWSGVGGALLLREAPSILPSTAAEIAAATRTGPGTMPAFGPSAITDDELDSVVRYVLYLQNPQDRGGHPLAHKGPLVEGAVAVVGGLGILLLMLRWIGTTR